MKIAERPGFPPPGSRGSVAGARTQVPFALQGPTIQRSRQQKVNTLQRYRGKEPAQFRVGQVNVGDGGQAIVGVVNKSGEAPLTHVADNSGATENVAGWRPAPCRP